MSFKVLFLRGSKAQNDAYVGPAGELTIDTTNYSLRVHDGTTAGGFEIMGRSQVASLLGGLEDQLDALENTNIAAISGDIEDLQAAVADRIKYADINISNGVAGLDGDGKIPLELLTDAVLGQVIYQGTWDASTNTPTLPATPTQKGDYYVTSATGTFQGIEYETGDWIISNGIGWQKVNNTDAVRTVAGRKGDVVLNKGDVGLSNVDNTSDANKPISTATQSALDDKVAKLNGQMTGTVTVDGKQVIRSGVTKAVGSSSENVFSILDSEDEALFQVRENGDTVIGGVLTVNGLGDSYFAGNVNIGGSIHVADGSTVDADFQGENLTITGNLIVHGNTALGDEHTDTIDITGRTIVDGKTTVVSEVAKVNGDSTTNAFEVVDANLDPLFEVRTNGDTTIAGVLTVNGDGDSYFAGNVNIGGSINVADGSTVEADFQGENLTLTGNLIVHGNTALGDEHTDTFDVKGITTFDGKTTIKSVVTKANGDNSTNAFEILDAADAPLFEVKTNGDTTIAGVLTVNGEGDSYFAGNVNIGGALTVADGATVNADFVGDDLTLNGNLVVKGDTTLGDDASDVINIIGTATATTQPLSDNSNKLATTAFVHDYFADVGFTQQGGNWVLDQGTM